MSLVKISRHGSVSSGPFKSSDQAIFQIPQGLIYDLDKSHLEYFLRVANDKATTAVTNALVFGDRSGLMTSPDILFSNAYMTDTRGLISHSQNHKIRKCNDYLYEQNWVTKNCNSTWGYEGYGDEDGVIQTVIEGGLTLDACIPKKIIHPLNRFFDRAKLHYDCKYSTEMRFELDPDQSGVKFCSIVNLNLPTRAFTPCNAGQISDTHAYLDNHRITFTTAFGSNAEAAIAFPVGSVVLVKYTIAAVEYQRTFQVGAIVAATLDFVNANAVDNLVAANVGADTAVTNISVQRYDSPPLGFAITGGRATAAGKIDLKKIILTGDFATREALPIFVGQTLRLDYTDATTVYFRQSRFFNDDFIVTVAAVNWVAGVGASSFTIVEDPVIARTAAGAENIADDYIIGGVVKSLYEDRTIIPVPNCDFQIENVNLVLHSITKDKYRVTPSSFYYLPVCETLNFTQGNRFSYDISIKQNCSLVCILTPTTGNVISTSDKAKHYRLAIDGRDTYTRDIDLPLPGGNSRCNPIYTYILRDNYGKIMNMERIKQDPALNSPIMMISQITPGGAQKLHIDLYADADNMSTKIIYVYQYILVMAMGDM